MSVNVWAIAQDTTIKHTSDKVIVQVLTNAAYVGNTAAAQTTRIKVAFSYGDATPKQVTNLQGLIKNASILILLPFNAPSTLALGDDLNSDRLISKTSNDPSAIAEYETSPLVQYASPTDIKLAIAPGVGCTQGSGFIILEV